MPRLVTVAGMTQGLLSLPSCGTSFSFHIGWYSSISTVGGTGESVSEEGKQFYLEEHKVEVPTLLLFLATTKSYVHTQL